MKQFWNDRAKENAAWYVDTSLDYSEPDMEQFFKTGQVIVEEALIDAPVQAEGRALAVDIGSGLGRISLALADHFDRVVGIDVSEEMVQQARKLVTNERVEFVVGDGVSLAPVQPGTVDFVTSFTVFQHLPSEQLVLQYFTQAAELLRPGGVLGIQWNNLPHPTLWHAKGAWWRFRGRVGLGMQNEQRNAREFIGTRVLWEPIEATLKSAGLDVCGRKGEGTLFSWVWARRPH